METGQQPRKSKAFIITFIVVILLLLLGYFLFMRNGGIFNAKGETVSQKFSSLFGSSKQKDVNTIDEAPAKETPETPTPDTPGTTPTGTTPTGPQTGNNPYVYVPGLNPIPTPTYTGAGGGTLPRFTNTAQCSDGIDNDRDGFIDRADPSCHVDFDASNPNSYLSTLNNEALTNTTPPPPTPPGAQCPAPEPLVLTAAEKKALDPLIRKFYSLAPSLASDNDVIAEQENAKRYQDLIDQIMGTAPTAEQLRNAASTAGRTVGDTIVFDNTMSPFPAPKDGLVGQCYATRMTAGQIRGYTGPQVKESDTNPYIQYIPPADRAFGQKEADIGGGYIKQGWRSGFFGPLGYDPGIDVHKFEKLFNIW